MNDERMLSLKEMREASGIPLGVNDFITKPDLCGNPRLYLPKIEAPSHLLGPDKAEQAQRLINKCLDLVGGIDFADQSKTDSKEFKKAAKQFKEITGVDAWELISTTRDKAWIQRELILD